MPPRIAEEVGIDSARILGSHDQQIIRPGCPVQPAVLNQTWFEVDERLLRLHLEASCSSIAAELCRMNVPSPSPTQWDAPWSLFPLGSRREALV